MHISHAGCSGRILRMARRVASQSLARVGFAAMTQAQVFRSEERGRMVDEIAALARAVPDTQHTELDARVLDAMRRVPRHEFVPPELRAAAYRNRPLPIGEGQTISQPYIVALMTDLLRLQPGDRVLEIGTGCGYQAAVAGRDRRRGLFDRDRRASRPHGGPNAAAPRLSRNDAHRRWLQGWPEAAPSMRLSSPPHPSTFRTRSSSS
ncbi:MAG: hypothetical protein WDN31_08165 [Hyphomicrobium sp.]